MSAAPITLQNGAVVEWRYPDAFQNANLYITKGPKEKDDKGCGNPWNWMTDAEAQKVRQAKPADRQKPCKVDSMMYHKIYRSQEEIGAELKAIIDADCWGVFTTNANRSEVYRVFFDTRRNDNNDKGQEERSRLARNPQDLLQSLDQNLTVVLVLGQFQFMEYYFFKVATGIYVSVHVDHSINW